MAARPRARTKALAGAGRARVRCFSKSVRPGALMPTATTCLATAEVTARARSSIWSCAEGSRCCHRWGSSTFVAAACDAAPFQSSPRGRHRLLFIPTGYASARKRAWLSPGRAPGCPPAGRATGRLRPGTAAAHTGVAPLAVGAALQVGKLAPGGAVMRRPPPAWLTRRRGEPAARMEEAASDSLATRQAAVVQARLEGTSPRWATLPGGG